MEIYCYFTINVIRNCECGHFIIDDNVLYELEQKHVDVKHKYSDYATRTAIFVPTVHGMHSFVCTYTVHTSAMQVVGGSGHAARTHKNETKQRALSKCYDTFEILFFHQCNSIGRMWSQYFHSTNLFEYRLHTHRDN